MRACVRLVHAARDRRAARECRRLGPKLRGARTRRAVLQRRGVGDARRRRRRRGGARHRRAAA